jgi:hypothetical protein
VSVLSEFRESRLFKAIADISVVHWLVTIVPGLVSGTAAAMHGRPLETVILYFVGLSALMLVVLQFGGLAWAKYWPKINQNAADASPYKLWGLIIPGMALIVMLGVGWLAKPKPSATSTGATVATNNGASAPQPSQQPRGDTPPQQSAQAAQSPSATHSRPTKKHKRRNDSSETASEITKPAAETQPTQQDNSVHVENGSKIEQHSTGDCSPNIIGGSAKVNCGPPAAQCLVTRTSANVPIDGLFDSSFAVSIVSGHPVGIQMSASGQYVVGITLSIIKDKPAQVVGHSKDPDTLIFETISAGDYLVVVHSSQQDDTALHCEER